MATKCTPPRKDSVQAAAVSTPKSAMCKRFQKRNFWRFQLLGDARMSSYWALPWRKQIAVL